MHLGLLPWSSSTFALRAPPPVCLLPVELPPSVLCSRDSAFAYGLPTEDEIPKIASTIVRSFYSDAASTAALDEDGAAETQLAVLDPSIPDELRPFPAQLHARWRTATQGLQWRLGPRFAQQQMQQQQKLEAVEMEENSSNNIMVEGAPLVVEGDLSVSLESSLLLAVQERATGELVGCAELSMRPIDGRLPGEFAVPALFQLHTGGEQGLAAYVSNLAVLPSYRRRRLGSELLAACEWIARDQWRQDAIYLHLNLFNDAATRLYADFEPLPDYDVECRPPEVEQQAAAGAGAAALAANGDGAKPPVHNRYYRKNLVPERDAVPAAAGQQQQQQQQQQ